MKHLTSIAVIAAFLAFPAMALAQSPSEVSGNDDFRSASSLVGGDGGGGGTDPGGGSGDPAGSSLAFTGFDAGLVAAAGLLLGGVGLSLRRRSAVADDTST